MSESSNLSSLARYKLHLSLNGRCSSLHRWVLLKNAIVSSAAPASEGEDVEEPAVADDEVDSFMFPDVEKFAEDPSSVDINGSEAQWLDSLLESLGEDEDYDEADTQSLSVDDDEEQLLSPIPSPMSSSDDLTSFYPPLLYPPLSVSYSVPYSQSIPYDHPLPYHDQDDIDELSVPDAIEDTSDDESEAPTTPSLVRSRSCISLVDPASVPLPSRPHPHIYIDTDDSYFYQFDPLPFPQDRFSYDSYQQC